MSSCGPSSPRQVHPMRGTKKHGQEVEPQRPRLLRLVAKERVMIRLVTRVWVVACIGLALDLSTPAWALAIYHYTGNAFANASIPYTTSDFITVSMTLPSQIPANQTNLDVRSELIDLTMSDGVQTIDLSSPNLQPLSTLAQFDTDNAGQITAWSVQLVRSDGSSTDQTTTFKMAGDGAEDIGNNGATLGGGINNGVPGTWTLVPEPHTMTLVAMGLVVICGVRSRSVWMTLGHIARPARRYNVHCTARLLVRLVKRPRRRSEHSRLV